MKTGVKITSAKNIGLMLLLCISANLYAQQNEPLPNRYYVEFRQNNLSVGKSSWLCGDDYHALEFKVLNIGGTTYTSVDKNNIYEGYGKSNGDFQKNVKFSPVSVMPKTITLIGKAGDESYRCDEDKYEWSYQKGDGPMVLVVNPSHTHGSCHRSLDAKYTAIVDDPVDVSYNPSKRAGSGSYTFSTGSERLTLNIGKFYENSKGQPELQVSRDNQKTWKYIQNVRPYERISLSYDTIVKKLAQPFDTLLGKPLYFRVVKNLLNGTQTYGKPTEQVVFYPDGIKFSVTSSKRTYCEEDVKLTVYLENPKDARYMELDTNRFRWVMVRDTAKLTNPFYCYMKPIGDNKFYIWPNLSLNLSWETLFMEEEDVVWYIQLQDSMQEDQYATKKPFTIPAKPRKITVSQKAPQFTIKDSTYYLPHRHSIYAMLDIDDPSYESHHRLPYTLLENGKSIAIIENPINSNYEALSREDKDRYDRQFEEEYYRSNLDVARQKYAEKWLLEQYGGNPIKMEFPAPYDTMAVSHIAVAPDGSFFLYSNNHDMYKATIIADRVSSISQVTLQDSVGHMEIVPDGSACIYKRYGQEGLFIVPLNKDHPVHGVLLSASAHDAAWDDTLYRYQGVEQPRRIFRNAQGNYEVVSEYGENGNNITLTRILIPEDFAEKTVDDEEDSGISEWEDIIADIIPESYNHYNKSAQSVYPCLSEHGVLSYISKYEFFFTNAGGHHVEYKIFVNDLVQGGTYSTEDYGYTKLSDQTGQMYYVKNLDINSSQALLVMIKTSDREVVIFKKDNGGYIAEPVSENIAYTQPFLRFMPQNDTFSSPDYMYLSDNEHTLKKGDIKLNFFKSFNIHFSTDGDYFMSIDLRSSIVYKQYLDLKNVKLKLEPDFKADYKKKWLAKVLGTKVSSGIKLDTLQNLVLQDADGCSYKVFQVFVTAPESPTLTPRIKKQPTNPCAKDGVAVITYKGGGVPAFVHPAGILENYGDSITVSGLKYGDNTIQFTDEVGNESHLLTVTITGAAEISAATVTNNTCATPNGKIRISVTGLPGDKIYELKNTAYPFCTYTYTTASNTYEFTEMPSGVYTVSVWQSDCHVEKSEEYEIESHIFSIAGVAVTPATTLEGKGSATFTFTNLSESEKWQEGAHLFDSPAINQYTVTTRSEGVTPGTYALSVSNNTGCVIDTNITIEKPTYWGEINLNYTKDSLRISTDYLDGNKWFELYKFRVIDATGAVITEDKKPNIVIRQPGNYAIYAHHAQDSLRLYDFPFPVDSIKANVQVAPPLCPQDMGTVTMTVQDGGFGNLSAVKMSMDGLNYTKPQTMNLDASVYNAWLRDTMVTPIDNLTIQAVLQQPLPFVVPAMEPVSAQIDYEAPSCAASADGRILLSNFTGGSGDYQYKINDNNEWKDTTIAIVGLGPGTYNVYLRDKKHLQCESQHLYGVKLRAPDTLKVNIINVKQPTCELGNGSLSATIQGGDGYYRYELYHNDNLMGSADYDTIPGINFGDTLKAGFYKLQIYDEHQCVASDTVTLHTYHNPRVETVRIANVSCAGAKDGTVELLTSSGTAPVDSVLLKHVYLPYTYSSTGTIFSQLDTGKYTLILHDTLGCYTTTPYPLFISEPEPLRIAVDTILPVVEKGSRSGRIIFHIYGGNAGHKTIWLKREDGVAIDSLMYINNAIPLSFTPYAGAYRIEVVDDKGCREITGELQIEEPASQLKFAIKEVKDARCKSQVGSITVEGVGGWGDYRYKHEQETSFTSLNTFDNLYPGHYIITVTDKLGATYSETIRIHEPKDSLKAEVTSRQLPTCGNNGAFAVQLSGGTPPYKLYEQDDTTFCAQLQTVVWAGKGSGNYLLHLVDNNGCRFELEENLPATALLAIEKMEVKYPLLPAASDGEIKVTVRGTAPYSYQWTQNVTTTLAINTPVLTNIPAGYYGVEVTDAGGCTIREAVMLTDSSYTPFTLLELGHETAFKAANGYAVLHAGVSLSDYTLIAPLNTKKTYASTDVTNTFRIQNDTVYLYDLNGGKWVIVGTNPDGHHVVSEFLINAYNEFIINNIFVSPVRKKGMSNGQVRIDIEGGGGDNRYNWTTSSGIPLPSADDEHSSMLRNVPAGTYVVKVEDCYGNILQREIGIEEPEQALTLAVADYQNQSCKTVQDAYVVLSAVGGWGDYQFRHRSEPYFSNSATYRNLEVAGHYFYVTDRQGVTDSVLVDITEPEYVRISVGIINPAKCKGAFDGEALFAIIGGTAPYSLSLLDSGIWQEGSLYGGLQAGSHTFVFKDKNSCISQDTLTVYITEPDSLLFKDIKVTHTTCEENNGKITVSVQGGAAPYQYQWTDLGNTVIGTNAEISGLSQNGIYHLKVTDHNGCTQQLEQLIQPSTRPVIAGLQTTPVKCYSDTTGSAQVVMVVPAEPYATYSLVWSNGDQGTVSNRFYEGTHHVTVTDANGCAATRYFDISQPDSLSLFATEVRNPHCYGYNDGQILTGTLGGVQGYTYQWSHGATIPDVENLTKGDYSVVVTDANGCVFQKSFTLGEPDAQTVDLGEDVVICPGNTHLLDGKDYVTYHWYTAAGDISNERYLPVREAGRYFLEATDARGCPAFGEVNIAIGNNALKADFLLASEAALGDTIMVFELSNMTLDSLRWEYDRTAFERIFWNNDYDYSYVLSLLSVQPGLHHIDLYAYAGGCYSRATKSVDIGAQRAPAAVPAMENAVSLITEVKLYPNPNNAVFAVEIKLREAADVRLVLFSVVPGARIDDRTERGSDYYHVTYNLPQLGTGMYVMMVMAGSERQLVKLIIAR